MSAFIPRPPLLQHHLRINRRPKLCASTPPPSVESVAARLRAELPRLFDDANPDYTLYAPSVTFEDPLNKFRGVSRYASNIAFLNNSPVFRSASFTLYDVAVVGDARDTVRTRWALSLAANLPWQPVATFTGQSDYIVDLQSGSVVRHVDYWDSLDDSRFPSLPAVKDLLAQCSPGRVSVGDLGGFELLRRTKTMEIRSFGREEGPGIVIRAAGEVKGVRQWQANAADDGEAYDRATLIDVGVKRLDENELGPAPFHAAEKQLRHELDAIDGVETSQNAYYVVLDLKGRRVHEVWVELSTVNVAVDF